jgi:hypothetical protein
MQTIHSEAPPKMQSEQRFSFIYFSLATALLALMAITLAYAVFIQDLAWLSNENGVMENIQVFFLALACVIFLWQSRFLQQPNKLLAIFLSLLAFAFVFREIDVQHLPVHSVVVFVFAEEGRLLYLIPLLLLLAQLVWKVPYFWQNKTTYCRSNTFVYMLLTTVLYAVVSNLFDKKIIPVADPYFFEEVVEIFATGFMFSAALFIRRDFAGMKYL